MTVEAHKNWEMPDMQKWPSADQLALLKSMNSALTAVGQAWVARQNGDDQRAHEWLAEATVELKSAENLLQKNHVDDILHVTRMISSLPGLQKKDASGSRVWQIAFTDKPIDIDLMATIRVDLQKRANVLQGKNLQANSSQLIQEKTDPVRGNLGKLLGTGF